MVMVLKPSPKLRLEMFRQAARPALRQSTPEW
jgi:hypothetical protein